MYFIPQKMSLNDAIQVPMPLDAVSSLIGGLLKYLPDRSTDHALSRSNASFVGSRTQIRFTHLSCIDVLRRFFRL